MKAFFSVFAAILAIAGILYLLNNYNRSQQPSPAMQSAIEIIPIEHASAAIVWSSEVVYTDPVGAAAAYAGVPAATLVLVTDIHGDHFSTSTLATLPAEAALIVPQAVKDRLPEELASRARVLANGESLTASGFTITAVPMYNIPESGDAFHTKGRGNGYLLEREGTRVYIAGDTSGTPEMRAMRGVDIALVPMNLPYTMSVAEAADAVLSFKPKAVYPYHYRGPEGLSDVAEFKRLVNAGDPSIEVILANWYPAR